MQASMAAETRADRSVWFFVAFTGLVFGSGGLLAKGLVDDGVDAFTVTWMPFLAGGVIGMVVATARRDLQMTAVAPAAVLGLGASAGPALLFNLGFERMSAGVVTLLISLGPVFTAVGAHFVFADERFNRTKAVGLVLALAGVGVLGLGGADSDATVGAIGIVLAGSLLAGSAAILARRFATEHGAPALIAPQLAVAGVAALLLSIPTGRGIAPEGGFASWHIPAMAAFGVTTYFGFFSMMKANEIGTTGQVSVIGYCVPLFGVVGGVAVFGDAVTAALVGGGLMIVVSVALIGAGSGGRRVSG
ncbi:MAG: DMT family transporter [Actinomycetota bacterium]